MIAEVAAIIAAIAAIHAAFFALRAMRIEAGSLLAGLILLSEPFFNVVGPVGEAASA